MSTALTQKTAAAGAQITLTRCAKSFRTHKALQPLDLQINAGETLALLGPSGCGKTTTLRIIAGLETPDDGGTVMYDGVDVTNVPIERRNVGMVFQSYALFPNMNVLENVKYGLRVRDYSASNANSRASEMLAMMRIEDLAQRRINELSGGQRQRVALARALAPQPRVLLLDEPLAALDARLRDVLRVEIDRLLRSLGITAIYVTHDQSEAMALGDRIAVMNNGVIAQIGTPEEIYFHPADAFVGDFVGTMNSIEHNGKRFTFRPEDIDLVDPTSATFTGTVTQRLFLGDHVQLAVSIDGASSDAPVTIRVRARNSPSLNDKIGLKLQPLTRLARDTH